MIRLVPFALVVAASCGGSRRVVEQCPEGLVVASPDGLGPRCVDPASECLAPEDCVPSSECCLSSCEPTGTAALWACAEDCITPSCDPAAPGCDADEHCLEYSECSAACVPVLPCDDGMVVADPDREGFRCIPADSLCFRPADCRASVDPCCQSYCGAAASGRYECLDDCEGNGDGECHGDDDCSARGEGYVCRGCPGVCVLFAEFECESDSDCVP